MQVIFRGVAINFGLGYISLQRLIDVDELDDEPEYDMGERLERFRKGKLEVYRYTQFPDRDYKFGWLLEIPEATYQIGGGIYARL